MTSAKKYVVAYDGTDFIGTDDETIAQTCVRNGIDSGKFHTVTMRSAGTVEVHRIERRVSVTRRLFSASPLNTLAKGA